ncbi:MAG: hypothetical protein R3F50_01560 [Gammaproteobacteria bacterium]
MVGATGAADPILRGIGIDIFDNSGLNDLVGALESGAFSQVQLAVQASELLEELGVIDTGQLALIGVAYEPVA